MLKRTRQSFVSPGQAQVNYDTPSKRTRKQTQSTQAVAGAKDENSLIPENGDLQLPSPARTRKGTRPSMHIDLSAITQSPDGISASPSELSPAVQAGHPSDQAGPDVSGASQGHTATRFNTGYFGNYQPPSRPLPADPRRPMTPVPGTVPKAMLGNRLRTAADHMKSHHFQYTPITAGQVRLLRLEQGSFKLERGTPVDLIRVALLTVPFHKLGTEYRFEALSYNWGEDNAAAPLIVRDESRPAPGISSIYQGVGRMLQPQDKIWVKYNLFEALYHLRSPTQDVWLWVDALCINQEDLEEKEVQVARIADIYVAAANVLVWLGEANHHTVSAMKLLHDLGVAGQQNQIKSDDSRLRAWKDLEHFMKSTWFGRRWVIQELALANNAVV